jgi:hypothetical protein
MGPHHPALRSHLTRAQMVDGLRQLAERSDLRLAWYTGEGWAGSASELLELAADELADMTRQPLTGPHGFVRHQQSPTRCLLVVTRADRTSGLALCGLAPEHPIHRGPDA